jgi:hypothetical protein
MYYYDIDLQGTLDPTTRKTELITHLEQFHPHSHWRSSASGNLHIITDHQDATLNIYQDPHFEKKICSSPL